MNSHDTINSTAVIGIGNIILNVDFLLVVTSLQLFLGITLFLSFTIAAHITMGERYSSTHRKKVPSLL